MALNLIELNSQHHSTLWIQSCFPDHLVQNKVKKNKTHYKGWGVKWHILNFYLNISIAFSLLCVRQLIRRLLVMSFGLQLAFSSKWGAQWLFQRVLFPTHKMFSLPLFSTNLGGGLCIFHLINMIERDGCILKHLRNYKSQKHVTFACLPTYLLA